MATKKRDEIPPVESGTFLSKTQIFALDDSVTEAIWVPAWNGYVKVRGLTAAERDKYESEMLEGKGKNSRINLSNARAKLLVLCCRNEDGSRMFSSAEMSALANKSAAALEPLFDAARRLSAMSEEDIEELTGNSETGPTSDSPSD